MKFQDALVAGSEQGTDHLPIEVDRRLRRRLGLESARAASTRRVWLRPAIGAFALAAIALVVIHYRPSQQSESPHRVAAGFADISKAPWSGTVTGNTLAVSAHSPASATVSWANATVVAAPGARMEATSTGSLVLAQGTIQLQRTEATPMSVVVPLGRVVIAAYRSSITADRQSVTVLLDDGTATYVDAKGQAHPIAPNAPLVWPPAADQRGTVSAPGAGSAGGASSPAQVAPSRKKHVTGAAAALAPAPAPAPVATQPDVPCTYKSDCEPGATCRENEHGASVCMGSGGQGAACWFDNDCQSLRCTQRRCASAPSSR